MTTEGAYGIGYFLNGHYHILCLDGDARRFHRIDPHSEREPALLDYHEARSFIETHPLCNNISNHVIRIMPISEVREIFEGRPAASTLKQELLREEEEYEERLH